MYFLIAGSGYTAEFIYEDTHFQPTVFVKGMGYRVYAPIDPGTTITPAGLPITYTAFEDDYAVINSRCTGGENVNLPKYSVRFRLPDGTLVTKSDLPLPHGVKEFYRSKINAGETIVIEHLALTMPTRLGENFNCTIGSGLERQHAIDARWTAYTTPSISITPSVINVATDQTGSWTAEAELRGSGIAGTELFIRTLNFKVLDIRAGSGEYKTINKAFGVTYKIGDRPAFTFASRLTFRGNVDGVGATKYIIQFNLQYP